MNTDGTQPGDDVKVFSGDGITVFYVRARCNKLGDCVRDLPAVFDPDKHPWIQPLNGSAEAVAQAVRSCPTGALHYELTDGPTEQPDSPTSIELKADGALYLRGDLRISLDDGELKETRATLCRCGRSANKPFCDRTCERTGWSSSWHPPAKD